MIRSNSVEVVIMPLTSKKAEIVVREVLEIDVVKGEVPSYYTGFSK